MRAIRIAVRGLAPLAAIVAVMAVPGVAAATPGEWTEYDGTPISSNVTADITGNIDIEIPNGGSPITASCEVTGEVELANEGPGGTAVQGIGNLQPVDILPNYGPIVCAGSWHSCPPSQVIYDTPWTGSTTAEYQSTFDNFAMSTLWCAGSGNFYAVSAGALSMTPFDVEVGTDYCIGGFESYESYVYDSEQTIYPTEVTARLELDLNTLDGLSTEEGGPCVKLAEA